MKRAVSRVIASLRRLGPHPVLVANYARYQAVTHWRRRSLRRTYAERVANPPAAGHLRLPSIDLPPLEDLPKQLAAAAETVRSEAELVLDHRVDLLGCLVDLGDEINWSRDYKSGYQWPLSFYQDVEVTRLSDRSDAKVPWELSRGHHLLTLARAATLFQDPRYAEELEEQLEHWLAANPAGHGINWANPMEVALRAVNWIWAIATLEAWRPLDPQLRMHVTRSLQAHGRHLAVNLEGTPYLRSNHFLSDVLGLLVLGDAIDGDAEAKRWLRFARRAFEAEIRAQVYPDGIGFEGSLPYHGLALEIFLLAKFVTDRDGTALSPKFTARLRQMLEASRALRHPNGRLPQFGDSDSGRVLPASSERKPTLDHLVWLGAAVFEQDRPFPGDPDPEVAWILGVGAWERLSRAGEADPPSQTSFPAAGVYVLRDQRLHAFVRCGDVGQNGNGGHAHNDLFSFELSTRVPIVVDSGTYVYTSDPGERNAFRSTRAHNTAAVAGAEINPIDERELFRLRQVAHARIELWQEREHDACLIASHDGYRRLRPAVTHRRSFLLERSAARFQVRDEILGAGKQSAESFLHLAAGTIVTRISEQEFELALDHETVALAFLGASTVQIVEGWLSDRFGVRKRAPVLVAGVSGLLPLSFGYEFVLAGAGEASERPGSVAARQA